MDDLSASTIVDSDAQVSQKRAEAEEARRVATAESRRGGGGGGGAQFREELCVCAVGCATLGRERDRSRVQDEVERGAEKRAGWCQVALEAAATLRRAAVAAGDTRPPVAGQRPAAA